MYEEEIERAVNGAAVPISIELDKMFADLPVDVDLSKVADELVLQLSTMSNRPEFAKLLTKALAARRALDELGIEF
jgi:hypothetical protein